MAHLHPLFTPPFTLCYSLCFYAIPQLVYSLLVSFTLLTGLPGRCPGLLRSLL